MPRHWLWLLLVSSACSSNDATIKQTYDYSDSAGRACQATLERSKPGSPSINQAVSCAGESKVCSTESSPCFVLNVDSESEDVRNCPACCKGNSTSFFGAECSPLVCESASDCVYAEATCVSGFCSCPGGFCR